MYHSEARYTRRLIIVGTASLLAILARPAQSQVAFDSSAAMAIVDRFHAALRSGDSAGAAGLLTADVVVLESGEMEDRAAYVAHHLPADIEFEKAVIEQRNLARLSLRGDVAWVSSTGRVKGKFRGRDVNSVSAELMILVRTPSGWRIAAVHWSSRRATP